ncbi:amidohydrolase family protein, partial [Chloroflexota bacterium]
IAMMDETGMDKVIIPAAQMYSYQLHKPVWDFKIKDVYAVTGKYPDRFVGLYGINPFMKMNGVRELELSVKEYGFKGALLHTYGYDKPLNHRDYWPFFAKCAELDVAVVMQVGHSAEFMPSSQGQPILIDDIALYFPELRIVAAHTGWPWVEELVAVSWKHSNVYIGTSAHAPKYWDKKLVDYLKTRGRGKVLFGTDWPTILYKEALDQVEGLGLKEEVKAQLLRETAVKVFKL